MKRAGSGQGTRMHGGHCTLGLFDIWRLLYSDISGISLIHEARIPREIAAIINSVRYQHHSLFSYRSQVAQAFSNNLATDRYGRAGY